MKSRTTSNEAKKADNPRVKAVSRLLHMARFIRERGTPDEAAEAVTWEQQLQKRHDELATAA